MQSSLTENQKLEVVKTALLSIQSLSLSAGQSQKVLQKKSIFLKALHTALIAAQSVLKIVEEETPEAQAALTSFSPQEPELEFPEFT